MPFSLSEEKKAWYNRAFDRIGDVLKTSLQSIKNYLNSEIRSERMDILKSIWSKSKKIIISVATFSFLFYLSTIKVGTFSGYWILLAIVLTLALLILLLMASSVYRLNRVDKIKIAEDVRTKSRFSFFSTGRDYFFTVPYWLKVVILITLVSFVWFAELFPSIDQIVQYTMSVSSGAGSQSIGFQLVLLGVVTIFLFVLLFLSQRRSSNVFKVAAMIYLVVFGFSQAGTILENAGRTSMASAEALIENQYLRRNCNVWGTYCNYLANHPDVKVEVKTKRNKKLCFKHLTPKEALLVEQWDKRNASWTRPVMYKEGKVFVWSDSLEKWVIYDGNGNPLPLDGTQKLRFSAPFMLEDAFIGFSTAHVSLDARCESVFI